MTKSFAPWLCMLVMGSLLASCGSTRHLQYMQGSFDTTRLSTYAVPELLIQQGDLLSIVVYSDNPAATAIYNQSVINAAPTNAAAQGSMGTGGGMASPVSPGYLVDKSGNIQFQGIGRLHVEGLTKAQLADTLVANLKDTLLTNPYVSIRFLNFKITIIGDVARPAVYSIPSERINLLEAIGLAGDLNITARRDNVLVIREQNGKRQWGRLDLTKPDIFTSPYYQLEQNDMVYVDFTKNKVVANDQTTVRNIGIATSVFSAVILLITVLRR